jgi:uncharacterized protein YndB with AHSA1/START domain
MFRGREEIFIQRPPDAVFRFLADLENDSRWMSMLVTSHRISEARGLGAIYERRYSGPLGVGQRTQVEVLALEPPHLLRLSLDAGAGTGSIEYRLAPARGGTLFVMDTSLQHRGALGLLAPLAAPMIRRADRRALAALKQLLEAG